MSPVPSLLARPTLARLALICALLAGCKLIDQTTFAPSPEAKPTSPVVQATATPPRVDPRTPLAVIDFSNADPAFRGPLAYAMRAAEARDPTVQFDVVGVAGSTDAAAAAQRHAVDVMRTMVTERIPASRLHLGLQTEPLMAGNQVRVYVR